MKSDQKWQIKYNLQKHTEKIQAARSTLNTGIRSGKNNNNKKEKKVNTKEYDSHRDSIFDSKTNISGLTENERDDLMKIPLYPLLKERGLQQYTKELVSRGYGYYLDGLCCLDDEDFDNLLNNIKVIPGHSERFRQLRRDMMSEMITKDKHRVKTNEDKRSAHNNTINSNNTKHMKTAKVKGIII